MTQTTPFFNSEPAVPAPFTFANFKTILRHAADDLGLNVFDDIESKGPDFKPFEHIESLTMMDIVLEMEELIDRDPRFDPSWEALSQKDYDKFITLGALYEKVCKAGNKTPIY